MTADRYSLVAPESGIMRAVLANADPVLTVLLVALVPISIVGWVQTYRWHVREIRAGRREPVWFGKRRQQTR
jgi:hypothetical protein